MNIRKWPSVYREYRGFPLVDVTPRRHWSVVVSAVATVLLVLALTGAYTAKTWSNPVATAQAGELPTAAPTSAPSGAPTAASTPIPTFKNVVMIIADDMDSGLFDQIPRLAALKDQGITFTNHVVTDSLCCPSRTSMMRSQYVHNHLVVSNMVESGGGWPTFVKRGEEPNSLGPWLKAGGITTGLIGKYLNQYPLNKPRYVPPGWNTWVVPTSTSGKPWEAYTGYNYTLNVNGTIVDHGSNPKDFLNDVLTASATDFIKTATNPFFLELSTYNPHDPSPVARRHQFDHLTTGVPRTPSFNALGVNDIPWMLRYPVMSAARVAKFDHHWQQRARSAESVADSVDAILATLRLTGHIDDTLLVVTSDNGYHAGVHRLLKGKRTAYQEDTVVPMIMIGKGLPTGYRVNAMTSTVDLAPTFASVLGATTPNWIDGRDLSPFFSGERPTPWRTGVVAESMGQSLPTDPDYTPHAPPQFTSLRTEEWVYTEYVDGNVELFDRVLDPFELNNIAAKANPTLLSQLQAQLKAMHTCAGATCRVADSMPS